ncbi:MAG: ArsA family ATPase, partial [Lachnospiraceae bacterium]|nr:ArsA family ATPase [Lachnospiraceae bacterium]
LKKVGDMIFDGLNPDEVLFKQEIYRTDTEKKLLSIYLPFASKDELILEQEKGEISVGVKNERRRFPIPAGLSGLDIAGAAFEDGYLNIRFGEEHDD